ncbi:MAG: endonuclease domain-containing protein [Balneolaceae bacterium]
MGTPINNSAYNKNLRSFAKSNRNDATKAEICLWKYALSKKQMGGYAFKRQRPALHYIADFMCQELKLIIEVDGITNDNDEQFKKDKIRQKALEQIGFTIIRFSDEDVLKNMESVRREIIKIVDKLSAHESSL